MTRRRIAQLLLALAGCCAGPAWAADDTGAAPASSLADVERSVVTQDGLRFSVPADWPIEKRGGAVGPIAVEDYVVRKFTTLETRLKAAEQRVTELERRVSALKAAGSAGALRSAATPPPAPAAAQTMSTPPVAVAPAVTVELSTTPSVTPADPPVTP